ncbi:MAG: LysR family transcriptional regulator [Betaproteobacteria bacterium]
MDILKLKSFVMVARLGHLTKASEKLFITQPAVTAHIKAIEEELGIALFTRSPGKITLTKSGQILLIEAEHVLDVFNGLINKAREMKGEITGSVKIATVDDSEFVKLGTFLYGLQATLPLLQLGISVVDEEELLSGISNGQFDGGFYIGVMDHPDFGKLHLRTVTYCAVGPTTLSANIAGLGWREMSDLPWIAAPKNSHIQRLQRYLFAQQGLAPREVVKCDQISAIGDLVKSGLGMALMREDQALKAVENNEAVIWRHARIEVPLSFVYRLKNEASPATVGMLSVLRQCWAL